MPIVEERSRITSKGQTTIPVAVRRALRVSYGGEIAFIVDESGVSVRRVEEDADPVIEGFLAFIAADMTRNPQSLAALPPELIERIEAVTSGRAVDLDERIDGPVEL